MILKIIKINIIKVVLPLLFLSFFGIAVFPKSALSAPGDYCASGVCEGTLRDVWDIPVGCTQISDYCVQNYTQITKNCDAYCAWEADSKSIIYCDESSHPPCETYTTSENVQGSCCVGGGSGEVNPCEMWCAPFYPPDESAKGCGTGGISCPEGQECRMPSNCGGSSCSCGAWRPWSECTKPCNDGTPGTHTRTRDCSPDACRAESETQDCNTQLCTGTVDGIVWSNNPINNDSNFQDNEDFTGAAPIACSPLTTNLSFGYGLNPRSIVGMSSSWFCDGNISKYITSNTVPMSVVGNLSRTIRISGVGSGSLSSYNCSGVSWAFTNRTTGAVSVGIGCSATVSNIASGNNNELHWNLKKSCEITNTYNLKIKVNEVTGVSTDLACPGIGNAPNGLTVLVQKTGLPTLSSAVSSGEVNFNNISVNYTNPNIVFTASGNITSGETTDVYDLVCPGVISYSPSTYTAVACEDKVITLGVTLSPKVGWVTAIDADIFAESIDVEIPLGTIDVATGFEKKLVNSKDGNTGGYIFSMLDKSTNDSYLYETDLGGYASQLGIDATSAWLDRFSFDAPNHSEVIALTEADLSGIESGKVYKMESDVFEDLVSSTTTTLTYPSITGIAILYVTQEDSASPSLVTITREIKTGGVGRLVIVSKPAITVDKSVGTSTALYSIDQTPNIMAAIISEGNILVDTYGTDPGTDIPVMLTAPFVSKTGIDFARDLGQTLNGRMPATSVLKHNPYLFYLASLEKEKSEDYIYYTGLTLTTYDLDFEYIY